MKQEKLPLGLYLHIPFCKQKCLYCDFYSLSDSDDRMDEYVAALLSQLIEIAPRAALHEVDTIYFGGGTPSYLGAKRLCHLLSMIGKHYHVAKDAEITLEANPDSAQDWKALRALRREGFNRLSLGMQSALDSELAAVGRVHTAAQTTAAVEAARRAKFDNLSLDLIYGLPDQTAESWDTTLRTALSYQPEHLSCYGLKIEENTPLYALRDTLSLADDDTQAERYLLTVDTLAAHGYEQYEISNFSQPERLSRHNMKYWTLGEYAGFGPGAHSDFGGVRYSYDADLSAYIDGALRRANMPVESEEIPEWGRDTEYLMLAARTARGIDPRHFEHTYRYRFAPLTPVLEQYRDMGCARLSADGTWRLTPRGFLLSNRIIGDLLDALAEDKKARMDATARGDFLVR